MTGSGASPISAYLFAGLIRKGLMFGGWIPLSVYLAIDLELTATQLLLLGTSIELSILLAEVPTGVFADTVSRKWSVVMGTMLLGTAQLCSGLVASFEAFLITQFVWGIGWTFISGAETAWLTDEIGGVDHAKPVILRRGRLQFIASIFGVVGLVALSVIIGSRETVVVAGASMILSGIALALAMKETVFVPVAGDRLRSGVETLAEGLRSARSSVALRLLAVVVGVAAFAAEGVDRTNVRRLGDLGLELSASAVLVVGGIAIAKSVVGWLAVREVERRHSGGGLVRAFGILIGLVAFGALAVAHVPFLAGVVVVLVIQSGLLDATDPLLTAWANSLAGDGQRATVLSLVGQVRAFGEIIGGVVLGVVAGLTTLPTALTVAAALFGVSALLALGRAGLAPARRAPVA